MDSDGHSNQHWTATWIFALTTLSLFTIVLIVAPFLSAGAKHSISYEIVYWYELVLMCLAVIAMVVHVVHLWKRNGQGDDGEPTRVEEITSSRSLTEIEGEETSSRSLTEIEEKKVFFAILQVIAKYIGPFAMVLCGLGSVVLPIFEISSIYNCVHMENNRMYDVRVASLAFIVGFSLVETVWLLILQRPIKFIDVTKWQNAIAIIFMILGNLVLCVRSIVDTVRATTTRANENRNDSMPQHFFDVTLVFSKCSNNTEIADTGVILSVYRFTYSFPFQFGFLALMLIFSVLFNNEKESLVHDCSEMCRQNNRSSLSDSPNNRLRLKEVVLKVSEYSHIVSPFYVLIMSIPYIVLEVLSGTLKNIDESANGSKYTKAVYGISFVHTLLNSLAPFCTLFWLWKYDVKSKLDFNKCLLMFCAIGNIFLCLFEIVDSFASVHHITDTDIKSYEGVYITNLIIRILGIYGQMIVIFDSHGFLEHETFVQNKQVCSHVRAILIFLAYDNGVSWLIETFLPAPALQQVYQIKKDDLFGERNWWLVVKLFTPLVLLYRLLSSVMCFKLAAKMKYITQETDNESIENDETRKLISD